MGLLVSLLVIALGSVLAYAAHVAVVGVNLDAVGLILVAAGISGVLLSLVFWPDGDARTATGREGRAA